MLRKFLLIGVGGSGGKTLRYTWRELDRRLRATGWTGGVPKAWRFLHIDPPENTDIVAGDIPATMAGAETYLGLARFPETYEQHDTLLCSRTDVLSAVAGWRPDPARLTDVLPFQGAGQRRVVGRVIALTQLDRIGRALDEAVSALSTNDVTQELNELNAHLKLSKESNAAPGTAVVFSSLAGGSGSGAFLDVMELLLARAVNQAEWLSVGLTSVLYAADVFDHLPEEARTGVEPNTLAALSELLSAHAHEGRVATAEDALLDPGGGTKALEGRRVGKNNFIIGTRNRHVTFAHSHDVFRAVGSAFAAFMTNDAVQSEFITYLNINPSAPSVTPSFGLMPSDAVSQPCSSFGYASVSLGRALFAQYAEERLAKRAVERFFRGHLERAPEGRRHETLIVERAERRKEVFFEATGLWEQGSGHNQVLDALREIAAKKSALDGVAEEMRHELGKSRRSLAPSAWLESFTTAFDALVERFEAAERERIHGTAMTWVREVQPRVLGAVADAIGRDGLPVAELLLDLLIQQVRDAAEELRAAGVRFSGEERGLLNLTKGLFLLGEKVITSNHQALDKATTHRRDALQRRTEGDLYTFTARLLDDIADNFLDVLRGTLQRLQPALRADVEGEYGTRVRQWSARAVPPHLTSAPNEILLEPQDAFPSRLDALLAQLFEGEGEDEAESHAVQEIITGAWPSVDAESGEATAQDLFHIRAWWAPANTLARPGSAPANIASVTADIGVDGIQAAAARWVRRRRGALTGFIDASLGEWLSPDQPDAAQRATRFVSSLDLALKAAEPLVSVNATTHQAVHGGRPPEPSVIISPIPLATDHRAYPQVSALLKSAGMTEGNLAGAFASNALGGQVEVSTFLGHAVHPVVMDSVFTPVQRAWQSADRRRFWEFRRARQIPSFVPLSPAYQRKLVRGWLAANMLGHVPPLTVPWSVAPLSVWAPDGRRPFPKHLLGGDVRTGVGILPALMESLPLALLSFAGNDTSELSAYVRLIELGGDDPMLADLTPPAGPELVAWVLRGEVTTALDGHEGAPTPAREVAGTAAGTSAERASALSGTLRDFAEQYRTVIGGRPVTRDSTLAIGAEWEVRGLVVGAATDLAAAVEAVTAAAASGTTGPTNLTI